MELIIYLIIICVAVYPAEWLLSHGWSHFYFSYGIPVYHRKILVKKSFSTKQEAMELTNIFKRGIGGHTVFNPISEQTIYFRDKFEFGGVHTPARKTFHGRITISEQNEKICLVSYLNWANPLLALCLTLLLMRSQTNTEKAFYISVIIFWLIHAIAQFNKLIKITRTIRSRHDLIKEHV